MKSTIERRSANGILLVAVILAAGLVAGSARAQSPSLFQGTFTLPYSAHWGKAVLPAGDYELSVAEQGESLIRVRNAKTGHLVAFEAINDVNDNTSGVSELVISNRGGKRVVYALSIAELGETFVYNPRLARAAAEEEAQQTRTILVTFAKK